MQIYDKSTTVKGEIERLKSKGKSIGFVPTMGALHEGHVALVRNSVDNNDVTVVSIFVNPIQFNDKKDLENYPRNMEKDVEMLENVKCDILFVPEVDEIYPDKVTEKYDFGHLETVMEGKYRSGHFNGVAVVVSRFFDIVNPNNAYFGLKDYQQYIIIRKLIEIQNREINLVGCPIVREVDGLAMSSRNVRISKENRNSAKEIYRILKDARSLKNKLSIKELKEYVQSEVAKIKVLDLEYFELVDSNSLLPVKQASVVEDMVGCIAVYLENVRLIDNIEF